MIKKLSLLFIVCSAISCGNNDDDPSAFIQNAKEHPTMTSENLTINDYVGGILSYTITTPQLERYEMVDTPYMYFPRGLDIKKFKDSTDIVINSLIADEAHYNEITKIWEANGNVIGRDSIGKTLYTEQLFWDERKHEIYSHVETKIVNGDEVTVGVGFESDDQMNEIRFKQIKGRMLLQMQEAKPDSLATDSLTTEEMQ